MNMRIAYGILGLGSLLIIAGALYTHFHEQNPAPTKKPVTQQAKQLDPLTIEAIRQRAYAASPITTERPANNQVNNASVVSFTSDGNKEYALLALPSASRPAGGYPVIILAHGYIPPDRYRTDSNDYRDWINSWTAAGFAVIKPDFRGNGQSQGQPESGHYSPGYTYDVLNLIASLKQYHAVDGSRIGLAGHSMGGHAALRAAVVTTDVKAMILVNGVVGSMHDLFFNWPHSPAPHDQPTAIVKSQLQNLIDTHGDPKSNPDFYSQASAINYVQHISGPVQINHDTDDSTVPVSFSQHLHDALVAAHKNVTFYQYPGDDHQFADPANHQLLLQRTTDFWQKNL